MRRIILSQAARFNVSRLLSVNTRFVRHVTNMAPTLEHAHPPNTCQYPAHTKRGDYLIQVAWPLCWGADRIPQENDAEGVSTLYVMDGNAYFFTAVDVSRRLEFTNSSRTVVVGIGYPPGKYVYDFRRGPDLTPPTADGKYDMPLDRDGNPRTDLAFGEADDFLDFVQHDVMTYVEKTLFPHVPLSTSRRALFGHSYGGIFALNALYTRPTLFDTFIAASPDIDWNLSSMVREQEAAFRGREHPANPPPALVLTWGTGQQDLVKGQDESEESFGKRLDCAESKTMRDSANALVERLNACPSVRTVSTWEFTGEDHGSAAVIGVQHGILKFLVDKI